MVGSRRKKVGTHPRTSSGCTGGLDPIECSDEGCGGKEVSGEFVVARGDTPLVYDVAEVIVDSADNVQNLSHFRD